MESRYGIIPHIVCTDAQNKQIFILGGGGGVDLSIYYSICDPPHGIDARGYTLLYQFSIPR